VSPHTFVELESGNADSRLQDPRSNLEAVWLAANLRWATVKPAALTIPPLHAQPLGAYVSKRIDSMTIQSSLRSSASVEGMKYASTTSRSPSMSRIHNRST
jgi:hypothetical protein